MVLWQACAPNSNILFSDVRRTPTKYELQAALSMKSTCGNKSGVVKGAMLKLFSARCLFPSIPFSLSCNLKFQLSNCKYAKPIRIFHRIASGAGFSRAGDHGAAPVRGTKGPGSNICYAAISSTSRSIRSFSSASAIFKS